VKGIIIPAHASEFSAWGIAGSDLVNLRQVSDPMLAPFNPARLNEIYAHLEKDARETLRREGFSDEAMRMKRYIDMRYRGQIHEVRVPVPTGTLGASELVQVHATFEDIYNRKYGQGASYRQAGVEARTYQVHGIGLIGRPATVRASIEGTDPSDAIKETRQVYFKGGFVPTKIYARERMHAGHQLVGPAIVEAVDTTVLIHAGQNLRIDEYGNMVVQ
jgi:N-methylhydantoinase A